MIYLAVWCLDIITETHWKCMTSAEPSKRAWKYVHTNLIQVYQTLEKYMHDIRYHFNARSMKYCHMDGMTCCRGERQEVGGIVWSASSRENESKGLKLSLDKLSDECVHCEWKVFPFHLKKEKRKSEKKNENPKIGCELAGLFSSQSEPK